MLKDFISLVFPHLCAACDAGLLKGENVICTSCTFNLPKTNFHFTDDNPVSMLFAGRVPVHTAAAYYIFNKGGPIQELVHKLKYNGRKEIGISIGRLYGMELKEAPLYKAIDVVIPVPLHKRKLRKRGYNQSEYFATGLSEMLNKPIELKSIARVHASETQTRKSKYRRWENVKEVFQVTDKEKLKDKHILLVDDVVTTGATLEACSQKLLEIPGTRVSIVAMAFAERG